MTVTPSLIKEQMNKSSGLIHMKFFFNNSMGFMIPQGVIYTLKIVPIMNIK